MKNNRFKHLLKLNTLLTAAIIVSDVMIIHPHNIDADNQANVRQVSVSHQMKQKAPTQLKSIQADEEQEFSAG